MLDADASRFKNWDQDVTTTELQYDRAEVQNAITNMSADSARHATAFDAVRPEQWNRTGLRSDGTTFTVETIGGYLVHDPTPHVWDVARGNAQLRG